MNAKCGIGSRPAPTKAGNAKFRIKMNRGGFTLIETIITLVVLSIAAVGVLSVFTVGIRGSANPLLVNQATQLAQGELDQVIGEKTASGFAAIAIGNPLVCNSTMLAGFTCSRNIFFVNPGDLNMQVGGPTNFKHITVTITQAAIGNVNVDALVTNY
jgi:prepilin-type N-terminal cleavage/methylation domain-containing protein